MRAPPPADDPPVRPAVLNRIRKAMVTSRLTFAERDSGGDPYNSRAARGPEAVWRGRTRD